MISARPTPSKPFSRNSIAAASRMRLRLSEMDPENETVG
jgi:hypothetical protein